MLTGAVVVQFGALSRHLPGSAEENREELQNTSLTVWNPGLSNRRVRSTSYSIAQGVRKCSAVQIVIKNTQCQYCICVNVQLVRLHRLGSAVTSTHKCSHAATPPLLHVVRARQRRICSGITSW
jgi:hypothetical protein